VLLGTGRRGESVVDLARRLLREEGGLAGRVGATPQGLMSRSGLGPAKTSSLLAAVELSRRIARSSFPDREPLTRPEAVARYLSITYGLQDQEVMGGLYLDTRNRLIGESEVFRGTLNRASVEPRPLLKRCLLSNAAGLVLFHTHPSGDPSPSAEDLAFTRRMAEAGEIVGVRLVDHLILGSAGRWTSLRQRGAW